MKGKTVLITGASSGIGEAIAAELAQIADGDINLVLVSRNIQKPDLKANIHTVKADISQCNASEWLSKLPPAFQKIDTLINCAGLALGRDTIGSLDLDDLGTLYATNVQGLMDLTNALVPQFIGRNTGDIVMIGSIAASETNTGNSLYTSSKAAVLAFTRALTKELVSTDIRVMEIDPGLVRTNFTNVRLKGQDPNASKIYDMYDALIPEDVAELVGFALTRRRNVVLAETRLVPTSQATINDMFARS